MVFICYICQIQMPIDRLPLARLTTKADMTKIRMRNVYLISFGSGITIIRPIRPCVLQSTLELSCWKDLI
jgi:hypothetical protein